MWQERPREPEPLYTLHFFHFQTGKLWPAAWDDFSFYTQDNVQCFSMQELPAVRILYGRTERRQTSGRRSYSSWANQLAVLTRRGILGVMGTTAGDSVCVQTPSEFDMFGCLHPAANIHKPTSREQRQSFGSSTLIPASPAAATTIIIITMILLFCNHVAALPAHCNWSSLFFCFFCCF